MLGISSRRLDPNSKAVRAVTTQAGRAKYKLYSLENGGKMDEVTGQGITHIDFL